MMHADCPCRDSNLDSLSRRQASVDENEGKEIGEEGGKSERDERKGSGSFMNYF